MVLVSLKLFKNLATLAAYQRFRYEFRLYIPVLEFLADDRVGSGALVQNYYGGRYPGIFKDVKIPEVHHLAD